MKTRILVLIAAISIAGCASDTPKQNADTAAPVKARQNVGVLTGELPILLLSVDGKQGPYRMEKPRPRGQLNQLFTPPGMYHYYGNGPKNYPFRRFEVELEPGPHGLEFTYIEGLEYLKKSQKITLDVEDGVLYQTSVLRDGQSISFAITPTK
jgi:hypothetical protein